MAALQKYFEEFHEAIRTDFETNATLREKRDIIIERIKKHLAKNSRPTFESLDQGSYAMKTGTVPPPPLEFDVDEGLRFAIMDTDYPAEVVRTWVLEAVEGHTDKVEDKGPCTRVTYAEPAGYHVDLVAYATWSDQSGIAQYRLAHNKRGWVPADPPALLDHVRKHREPFEGTEDQATGTDQFRRIVRYLKRWNDHHVPTERDDKLSGLAFTLLCCEHLAPSKDWSTGKPLDRDALAALARKVALVPDRVRATKPTPEHEDMFARLGADEMIQVKRRFGALADALDAAGAEADPVVACQKLKVVLGPDFPVPSPDDTGKASSAPSIITSSSSA